MSKATHNGGRARRPRSRDGLLIALVAAGVIGGALVVYVALSDDDGGALRRSTSPSVAAHTATEDADLAASPAWSGDNGAASESSGVTRVDAPTIDAATDSPPANREQGDLEEVNEAEGAELVDVPGTGHSAWDIESQEPPAFYDETIRFPDDAGVIDVTKPPYNARGDGRTDCSDAIQKALDDHPSENRIIYLPNGTYLVSHTISWPPSARLNPGKEIKGEWGSVHRLTILQGQNRDRTIIKVKDNCDEFQDGGWDEKSKRPKGRPVIYTGGWPAQRFRNAVRNLTVDTGKGNPGAIGMQFNASNQGTIHRVKIVSRDGQGTIGLDIGYCGDHGPASGRHIEIIGFDWGVWAGSMNGMTLWDVKLSKQNKVGLQARAEVTMVRRLQSDNSVTAVVVGPEGYTHFTLDDAELRGGSPDMPAIRYDDGHFYARDVTAEGYGLTIENKKDAARNATGSVAEYSARAPQKLFDQAVTKGLRLPVKYAPEVPWGDIRKDWANVMTFGAVGDEKHDDTEAIQKAIDSGAKTVYFPAGHVYEFDEIVIRGNVCRLIGCEAYLNGNRAVIGDTTAPVVIVERFHPSWNHGRQTHVYLENDKTLILRDLVGWSPHHRGTGDLFLEDVCTTMFIERPGARAWCRFFNYEPDKMLGLVNNGGYVWLFGGKTEHYGPKMLLTNGSKTELLGSWFYASFRGHVDKPGIEIVNSDATITTHRQFSFSTGSWPEYVVERRGTQRRVWKNWDIEFFSARIEDTTPPTVPDGLTARSENESSAELAWAAASDPDTGIGFYRVYRDGTLVATVDDGATRFTDSDLAEKTKHAYDVSAVNWGGTESRGRRVVITTVADTTPPKLIGAFSSADRASTTVLFDEPIAPKEASKAGNFTIDNDVRVLSAELRDDGRSVLLKTGALDVGTQYSLGVAGITDRASVPNAIAPDSTFAFRAAGDGLLGMYFSGTNFETKQFERVDGRVAFEWGRSPGQGIGDDHFSVRWTGSLVPRHTEHYTIFTKSDDGSRLWIDGRQVVNQWRDQGPTEVGGQIELQAGRQYSVKLEYYEKSGGAMCELWWQSPSTPKEIIPETSLYSR